ncbi:hypothetical protein CARUB_v10015244mg [Capsella rubella]|uniref:Prolamin-like domain-containing protein n=1 Tax=Capsella rubella TaxID=81985 RepID=R0I6E6_9BRAS|nr:hypothetical protein CARUB_v10015244mg [Capsella rubella]
MDMVMMMFSLVLILALISRPSEAAAPLHNYCLTRWIDAVPGCYARLRFYVGTKDIRWLNASCCKAVHATLPGFCTLKIKPGVIVQMTVLRWACKDVPSAPGPYV